MRVKLFQCRGPVGFGEIEEVGRRHEVTVAVGTDSIDDLARRYRARSSSRFRFASNEDGPNVPWEQVKVNFGWT